MRILADTHILLWQFLDDPKLTERFKDVLYDTDNDILISDATFWEIAIKLQVGKLQLKLPQFEAEVSYHRYGTIPIAREHFIAVSSLPRRHGDPFDHLLIAQAQCEGLAILTADEKFKAYSVKLALE